MNSSMLLLRPYQGLSKFGATTPSRDGTDNSGDNKP